MTESDTSDLGLATVPNYSSFCRQLSQRTTGGAAIALAAIVAAVVVFCLDVIIAQPIAFAVLYIVAIFVVAGSGRRRWVLRTAVGCLFLTVVGFFVTHGFQATLQQASRLLLSVAAIGVTTIHALKEIAASNLLQAQVRLLDQTHDSVTVRDLSGVITYWNKGAERLYGWTASEARGQSSHRLLGSNAAQSLSEFNKVLLETGAWEGKLRNRSKDGRNVIVDSRWSLLRDENGHPVKVLETANDVTAQAALREAQIDLAHAMRLTSLGELTASIAHEVNQPLAGIVSNGQAGLRWLCRDAPDLAAVRTSLESVVREANRAASVITGIRALARNDPPRPSFLDINEIVEECAKLLLQEIRSAEIDLKMSLSCSPASVLADRVQIQQVVINLLLNGIQAMKGIGDHPKLLTVKTWTGAGDVTVAVRDSGPGIDSRIRERLFNAFVTNKSDGMGIGLSVCRSIIERSGGRIWADSEDTLGAAFHFSLPLSERSSHVQ